MSRTASAIGCRVKSGWAVAVLVVGPAPAPRVLDRRRVVLSDPSVPESTQPYHAGFGKARKAGPALRCLIRIVRRRASRSMSAMIKAYRAAGHRPSRMGIVVGSTAAPGSIANPHIRAHAEEGRLFRTVVEAAARRHGIRPVVTRERDLFAVAAWLALASRRASSTR